MRSDPGAIVETGGTATYCASCGTAAEREDQPDTPPLTWPLDLGRPLFVYGALHPDELGFDQIADVVRSHRPSRVSGVLRMLDGLAVLDQGSRGDVAGTLLWFSDPVEAYRRVCSFEPSTIYRWDAVRAAVEGSSRNEVDANTLTAALAADGATSILSRCDGGDVVNRWSSTTDPLFISGMAVVAAMAIEAGLEPFGRLADRDVASWARFYRLQAAYLLASTVLERVAYLTVGARLGPTARITELGKRPDFRAIVRQNGVSDPQRSVGRSNNPLARRTARSSGAGFADRAYQIRSNLMHRGKSAYQEADLVRLALLDLHDVLRGYLSARVPDLTHRWGEVEPDGVGRNWLLKPLVGGVG